MLSWLPRPAGTERWAGSRPAPGADAQPGAGQWVGADTLIGADTQSGADTLVGPYTALAGPLAGVDTQSGADTLVGPYTAPAGPLTRADTLVGPYTAPAGPLAGAGPWHKSTARRPAVAVPAPDPALRPAYDACTRVIRSHSASFYFSARLLPPAKRSAVLALYAFCRLSDELVDNAGARGLTAGQAEAELAAWTQRCRCLPPGAAESEPVVLAWADTRRRFGIPQALADELLAGVSMDLTIARYATWADLWIYCYRVASTVGQMSMHITGALDRAATNYAIRLGVALQLTNILRDVGEDARQGRIYLPLADLARFRYTERDLLAGVIDERFVRLMQFEIARARTLFMQAWPGIAMLPADSRLAVAAAATVYRAILGRIEANGYDVFTRRARVPNRAKFALLPRVWWRLRRNFEF